ncbi:MAG: hypothetical protein KGJ62_09765 [Armatimonadetes bacterium]|nr:hypothetical protein [Armatimonadota bacterium]MDE2205767.1 hypothetical protein [Armatimonadota bacterium]
MVTLHYSVRRRAASNSIRAAIAILPLIMSTRVAAAHPPELHPAAVPFCKALSDGWAVDDQRHVLLTEPEARELHGAGARWARVEFRLPPGCQRWSGAVTAAYQVVIRNLIREHVQPLGLLDAGSWHGGQKLWLQGSAETGSGDGSNPYLRAWCADALLPLLKAFPQVRAWEVWNEPNCWTRHSPGAPGVLPGGSYLYPSNFAWLLTETWKTVRACSPGSLVVAGGILTAGFTHSVAANVATEYIRATVSAGNQLDGWSDLPAECGGAPVDAWGLHLYPDSDSRVASGVIDAYYTAFRKALVAALPRQGAAAVWVTEIGWAARTGDVRAEAREAANLVEAFTELAQQPGIGPVFWFTLHDNPSAGLWYGLRTANDQPKPAWAAWKSIR